MVRAKAFFFAKITIEGGRGVEGEAIWARDDKDLRGILRELRRHREKKKSFRKG